MAQTQAICGLFFTIFEEVVSLQNCGATLLIIGLGFSGAMSFLFAFLVSLGEALCGFETFVPFLICCGVFTTGVSALIFLFFFFLPFLRTATRYFISSGISPIAAKAFFKLSRVSRFIDIKFVGARSPLQCLAAASYTSAASTSVWNLPRYLTRLESRILACHFRSLPQHDTPRNLEVCFCLEESGDMASASKGDLIFNDFVSASFLGLPSL
mmetsp:Transcript_19792/g.25299  ORF Transcript_19792/g.25299 Transcript_19792/m.25299 type:complete len:212 (+) Transcript_19792:1666-2301(+)